MGSQRFCARFFSRRSWERRGDDSSPLLSIMLALSVCVAAGWRRRIVRVRAEGAQSGLGVRNAEHGKWSSLMLAVERRGLGRIEVASGQSRSVLRIIEPKTQMERVRGSQAHIRVKAEDIIQENRFYLDMAVIGSVTNLDIGLIPSQTETTREIGILSAIGLKKAVLYGEQIECETRFDPVEIQDQRIILFSANNRRAGSRLLKGIGAKTINDRWIRQQVESDLVLRILGGGDAGDDQDCERRQQPASNAVSGSAAPELLSAIVVHYILLIL